MAKITPIPCPTCKIVCDGATSAEKPGKDIRPKDGDLSICIYCGTMAQFYDNATKTKALTDEELYSLNLDGHTRLVIHKAREAWEETVKGKIKH